MTCSTIDTRLGTPTTADLTGPDVAQNRGCGTCPMWCGEADCNQLWPTVNGIDWV
ncbi:hypothetical protein [Actinocrispum wychmicini]|uniref:Uncharacterized protein n=1 Tax=Actinocrispum wychmicini TaxID=1213861 RepID=A0A4V2S4F0_9PSEU|nr:hypothetical protein [Actinocrispum wychmicini]TCO48000.1 hypothetical protein EV192_11653 [Actinocrispum wychmicini]